MTHDSIPLAPPAVRAAAAIAIVLAAASSLGCGGAPLSVEEEEPLPVPIAFGEGDFPVYGLSRSGVALVGKVEASSPLEAGRTVLRRIGAPAARISFPDGFRAEAIHVDPDLEVYAFGEGGEPPRTWRLVKISPASDVRWDVPVPEVEREGFRLSFGTREWRNVSIVVGPGKDELSFIWSRSASKPDLGILSFRRADGKVTRLEDGLRPLSGPGYEVTPAGVYTAARKDAPGDEVLLFEGRPWAVDFFRGRLFIQVSDDGGKTGTVFYLRAGEARPAVDDPLPFPVRNDGAAAFYILDPDRRALRLFRISLE